MSRRGPGVIGAALLAILCGCGGGQEKEVEVAPPPKPESLEARAERLAHEFVIYDGHIDLPYRLENLDKEGKAAPDLSISGEEGNFDAIKAKKGGLDAPFMSIYIPARLQKTGGAKKLADGLIDRVEKIVETWPQHFSLAKTPAQVRENHRAGKVSLLLGIENGAAIEDELANVEHFFQRGVRYITLTHSKNNLICDSSYDKQRKWKGLSPFGVKVVGEMNRLGILVDISHVSDDTFWQVLETSTKPVIASHSSLRHFTPGFERNMSDDMVKALAKNGGVVMVNFGSTFISAKANSWSSERYDRQHKLEAANPKASAEQIETMMQEWLAENPLPYADVRDVADHIDRVVQLAGVDHVGFGSDFDGVGDSLPTGLKDASFYPSLIRELLSRGYSDEDIAKIASGNLERVWLAQNNSRPSDDSPPS